MSEMKRDAMTKEHARELLKAVLELLGQGYMELPVTLHNELIDYREYLKSVIHPEREEEL